ncbi:MAG: aminoglycoside [Rhodospirillaceae bacterium]|nr:MAG: aminoglycoside [Rhodospirillaceae bacterium]TNC97439.1 MAG: aminoglycoside N3'-acetyltransferase [Stygiobacter sp.]
MAGLFVTAGIDAGMDVMVHSALGRLGYLVNGAHDAIDAMLDVLGSDGTMLVPAQSGHLTDPAEWKNPPVPPAWQDVIRANMAPFDPHRTPARNRGMLVETFLSYPQMRRSHHPIASIAAIGAKAQYYTQDHPLHEMLGIGSPVHKLYLADGHVLFMNTGLAACTALHLAEFMAGDHFVTQRQVTILVEDENGRRFERLRKYPGLAHNFETLRQDFIAAGCLRETWLDDYRFTLLTLRPAVDLAVRRLQQDPEFLDRS